MAFCCKVDRLDRLVWCIPEAEADTLSQVRAEDEEVGAEACPSLLLWVESWTLKS